VTFKAQTIYGPDVMTLKVHALPHMAAASLDFGPWSSFSAFPFEVPESREFVFLSAVNLIAEQKRHHCQVESCDSWRCCDHKSGLALLR
jgi:hypothetical protein